jgi:Cu/Ag efflux protein CusF
MKARTTAVLAVTAVALALAAAAPAQTEQTQVQMGGGKLELGRLVEATGKVEAIDLAKREVTIKGPRGNSVTVVADEEVKNLAQLAVGDDVEMQYYESLALQLEKTTTPLSVSESTEQVRAEPGQKPGAAELYQVTVVAKVQAIDPKASVVTLVGPRGNAVDVTVPAEALAKVKVGDHVRAVYSQAVAISVSEVVVK